MPPQVVTSRVGVDGAHTFPVARRLGAYRSLERALTIAPNAIVDTVAASGLTGRSGGAGFPTATKWKLLGNSFPRYVVCNGDESEPGTAKDRVLMERDPHQLIEGALICAYAVGAKLVVIYVRGEMALAQERLVVAANDAYRHGMCGASIGGTAVSIDVVVHCGAGAYIVGEETALLESLEGNRGMPRIKPPNFPAAIGLYGKPTVVNNVETLSSLPWIVANGGDRFAAIGAHRSRGVRLFTLSGHVNRPGNYELALHETTFRDLLYDERYGAGILGGAALKAFVVGASFPWFFPEQLDLPMDIDVVAANGSSLGSGIIVLSDRACAVRMGWNLTRFFASESCGKCVPCREGGRWMEQVMARILDGTGRPSDLDLLEQIGDTISPSPYPRPARESGAIAAIPFPPRQTTICPLGPSIVAPMLSSLQHFRDEYEEHLTTGTCSRCAEAPHAR